MKTWSFVKETGFNVYLKKWKNQTHSLSFRIMYRINLYTVFLYLHKDYVECS